jgi:hypothetical protein
MNLHRTNKILIFVFMLLLSTRLVTAQEAAPSTGAPAAGEPAAQPADETPMGDTAMNAPLSIFGDPITGHLNFSGDANVRYEHDDNVLASSLFRFSDNITSVSGRIGAAIQKKKLLFQMHYAPSFRMYAELEDRNTFSQQFANSMTYRFDARTSLHWNGSLSDTSTSASSPFSFVNLGGTIVPIFHPTALQTNARILYSSGSLGLDHKFTARSGMHITVRGATTNFFEQNGVPLVSGRAREQYSAGANVGWDYEFVPGKKLGAEGGYSYFGFADPASHTNFEFAKLRYEQGIGRGFSFSVGAGPSVRQRQGLDDASIGYAMDVTLSKQAARYNVIGHYGRGNSLGSTQGTLTTDSVSIALSRSLMRRWDVGGSLGYSRSAHPETSDLALQSLGTNVQVGYALSPTIRAYTSYSYANQFGRSGPLAVYNFDRNLFAFGIGYTFGAAVRR